MAIKNANNLKIHVKFMFAIFRLLQLIVTFYIGDIYLHGNYFN